MLNADSRTKGGAGLLPLQAQNAGKWKIETRPSILAYRLVDRLDHPGQLGHYVYEESSIGDLIGALNWPNNTRPLSGWSWAWPSITLEQETLLPVKDKDWNPDDRFGTIKRNLPKLKGNAVWPKSPKGTYGITLAGTDETQQAELFFPIDPRLVAPNAYGDPEMGSMVCDLNFKSEIDPDRVARLQSAFRVIKGIKKTTQERTPGTVDTVAEIRGAGRNAIAFQLGNSGLLDTFGGLFADSIGTEIVIGNGSRYNGNGPFDVGSSKDRHRIGKDADGHAINSLHLSTRALFRQNDKFDGPLNFEGAFQGATPQPFRSPVHLEFGGGVWRWSAEVPMYTVTNIGKDKNTKNPTGLEDTPTERSGNNTPSGSGLIDTPTQGAQGPPPNMGSGRAGATANLPFMATTMETAFPSLLIRPQSFRKPTEDFRNHNGQMDEATRRKIDATVPISLRMEGYAGQGGEHEPQGSIEEFAGASADPWLYTKKPGNAGYAGGTASGGITLYPPELGMEDFVTKDGFGNFPGQWKIAQGGVSENYFVAGPNVFFGCGIPDIVVGSINVGWSWGTQIPTDTNEPVFESPNDFVIRRHRGTEGENYFRIGASDGNIGWRSFTNFWGTLNHSNTAARQWDFPNVSGTVLLSAAGGGTFTAGSVIFAGTGGLLAQDNANFFWDDTLNRLGLGTTSPTGKIHVSMNENIPTLQLDQTGEFISELRIRKLDTTPTAGDDLGNLSFFARDSASNIDLYAHMKATIEDPTSGSEDASYTFYTVVAGTLRARLSMRPTETIINDENIDLDFRVAGDNDINLLFCDASTDFVGVKTSAPLVALDINGGQAVRATTNATLTANQDNYAIGAGTFFRLSSDASRNITGMTGGVNGKLIIIVNVGSNDIVFTNQDAASTAANRIITGTGASVTLSADDTAYFIYDATTSRWRIINTH